MSREVAIAAIKLGMENSGTSGLLFYGGEPLLEKELIYDVIEHTKSIKRKTGHNFNYKITTNGLLLDEEFLKFASDVNMAIGVSYDGPAQDNCRCLQDGTGTSSILDDKIPLLLAHHPYAMGLSVVDPATVDKASEIVHCLYEKGFRYIHMGINYSKTAPWTKELLLTLQHEYKKIAEMYIDWTRRENKFYFSNFDMKILSHLKGEKYNIDRARMNKNQPSVAPDGKVYTMTRHLNNPVFEIGNVFTGINKIRHKKIYERGAIPAEPCRKCAIKSRCNYAYDNLANKGPAFVDDITPVQCAHERLVTPIADYAAQTLYKEQNAMFLQKHYNDLYPIMSFWEDIAINH